MQVVYLGDSVRSDVWPTNLYAKWSSIAILEEMEAEGLVHDSSEEEPPPKMAKMAKVINESLDTTLYGINANCG